VWDINDPEPPQCRADRADWGAFIQSLYDLIDSKEGQNDEKPRV